LLLPVLFVVIPQRSGGIRFFFLLFVFFAKCVLSTIHKTPVISVRIEVQKLFFAFFPPKSHVKPENHPTR
jgi:hypothetical protein